ncbi:MAG: nucleoside triphosphate pyrophosphohydrolase [Bacteroidetes bacterium]|nr:MAG: nucleoside triphosphate pyrophosphohydrolase [Bacteroidota bacterium]PIE87647.1 MAG: nucleoside triphosphate pyrophosphohydrolase [Bacteroidota bacterium]
MDRRLEAFKRLLDIMDELREKCPWDKKQTLESLRYLTIEETYELSDAILDNDLNEVRKELGDLMLHLVFYAKIGEEKSAFNITDVLTGISEKLIHRHPHIFGNVVAEDEKTVKDNWERIKMKEGRKSVLSGVPKSMPAMVKAFRMQEKASGVGFDWPHIDQVKEKIEEERLELEKELKNGADPGRVEAEFGDLLFAFVNYARFLNINPDDALERTNKKFIKRFTYIEEQAKKKGKVLHEMSLDEMETLWQKSKSEEPTP